jgi:hypothetical protein
VTALLVLVAALVLQTQGAPQESPAVPTPAELEAEVLDNVKAQPLADGTVADLALPDEFLRRVADRIVRSSYEERYRVVVRDQASPAHAEESPLGALARSPVVLGVAGLGVASIAWILFSRRKERAQA